MAIDLSKSIYDSLQKGLKRARALVEAGNAAAAREAFDRCAQLADRYAGYAVPGPERKRRAALAAQYRQRAAELREHGLAPARGPADAPPAPAEATADETDEYRAAAAALIEKAAVSWEDIAGLADVKDQIRMSYGFAMAARPDGVRLNTGRNLLFFGPPGTGKTLLAAAASRELEATFFNVKTANVLSKYFGESARLIEALYAVAREKAPSVIFFDEFDALSARRDGPDSGGPERRMMATLLAELDGLAEKGGEVFLLTLAATNLPWAIDSAVLSRFDRRVYVPLPDETVRRGIVELHVGRQGYAFDGDLSQLVGATAGLSGRRIAQLCEAAVRRMAVEQNPDLLRRVDAGRKAVESYTLKLRPLTMADFESELAGATPEVTADQLARYAQWHQAQN